MATPEEIQAFEQAQKLKTHEQSKSFRLSALITSSANAMIDGRSDELGISRGEYLERLIRWADAHWSEEMKDELSKEPNDD